MVIGSATYLLCILNIDNIGKDKLHTTAGCPYNKRQILLIKSLVEKQFEPISLQGLWADVDP